MSIPVLIEVYDEMRRLAIAGSAVAPGDFRLKKLIPPLEKSGEKAPVFAKVAQAATARKAMAASGPLGRTMATRSLRPTPKALSWPARCVTCERNWS